MNPIHIDHASALEPMNRIPINPKSEDVGTAGDRVSTMNNKIRVLIVDDDPMVRQVVSEMVRRLGCQTTAAEDALMALYHLNQNRYDVVIADYDMPFIDGYELADQIKEIYLGTKVIMMTGHGDTEVSDLLKNSSLVDGLLLKPFNIRAIKEKLESTL